MRTVPITLPTWFTIVQRLVIKAVVAIAGASIAGLFALLLVQAVVYRDFRSYALAGNPWDPSSFPWYVIDSMRLLTIVAGVMIGSIIFVPVYACIVFATRRLARADGSWEAMRRVLSAIGTLAFMLAAAAWFGRWFG
jgi:hypothetical protein